MEPTVVRRDELLLGVQRVDWWVQIGQIVVVDPATLLFSVFNQLDSLSDHITNPEETKEASQVHITPLEGNLCDFATKEHAKRIDWQHEAWLFVRDVREDNKVEEDGVGKIWALILTPSFVDMIETSQDKRWINYPEAFGY